MTNGSNDCCNNMQKITSDCRIYMAENERVKALPKVPLYEHAITIRGDPTFS
jgi:hypothetical protein